MKQIVSIAVLTIIFIFLSLYANYYLESSAKEITGHIKNIELYVKKNDWTNANKELNISKTKWDNVKDKWAMLIDHYEIDNIDSSLSKVSGFVQTKSQNEFLAESSNLILMVDHIPEKDLPSLKNVL